jgi:hypothetical protein
LAEVTCFVPFDSVGFKRFRESLTICRTQSSKYSDSESENEKGKMLAYIIDEHELLPISSSSVDLYSDSPGYPERQKAWF